MASFLLQRCFGRYQNLLRMVLIDSAPLVTAPKEAFLQKLVLDFSFLSIAILYKTIH
jgi:hypothetical protein